MAEDEYCRKCRSKLTTCPTCKGKGMISEESLLTISHKPCPNCKGTGKLCPKHGYDWGQNCSCFCKCLQNIYLVSYNACLATQRLQAIIANVSTYRKTLCIIQCKRSDILHTRKEIILKILCAFILSLLLSQRQLLYIVQSFHHCRNLNHTGNKFFL